MSPRTLPTGVVSPRTGVAPNRPVVGVFPVPPRTVGTGLVVESPGVPSAGAQGAPTSAGGES